MRKAYIAAAVFAVVFAALAVVRWRLWSYGSDTGTFTQAILAAGHGWVDGPERGSHFIYHFSPILALLYPALALTHSPLVLQIAQVALVAAVAPVAYAVLAPYVGETSAVRFSILALVYPPLTALAFGEFHEVAFLPVLGLALFWAADRGKWWWFATFGAGCCATREDVCIELSVVAAALAILFAIGRRPGDGLLVGRPKDPRATAIAFGALSVFAAVVVGSYYLWLFDVHGSWPHTHFYDYPFARGPLAVIAALFTAPLVALPALAQPGRLTYIVEAFAPLLFLPFLSRWLWAAVPSFVVVLLAAEQSVWRMGNHYAALWIPWVLVATAAAIVRLRDRLGERKVGLWTWGSIGACALTLIAFDPSHPIHYLRAPYADLASARAALACVPATASVSTHDEWFAEIAGRYPNATIQHTSGTQYLVYADDFPNAVFATQQLPRLRQDVLDGEYRVACRFGHVIAYVARSRERKSAR